jgi:hypothetical protein
MSIQLYKQLNFSHNLCDSLTSFNFDYRLEASKFLNNKSKWPSWKSMLRESWKCFFFTLTKIPFCYDDYFIFFNLTKLKVCFLLKQDMF